MNLIDRDALAKALGIKEKCTDCERNINVHFCVMGNEFAWACEAIFDAPVIKQPEIIYCKDCKFGRAFETSRGKLLYECRLHDDNTACDPDDYCSRAEREEV